MYVDTKQMEGTRFIIAAVSIKVCTCISADVDLWPLAYRQFLCRYYAAQRAMQINTPLRIYKYVMFTLDVLEYEKIQEEDS